MHAVLEEAGRGPFAIAGTLGGLIPNPGIVEGAAVAVAWDIRDDLDPDQWSKIMMDRNELPSAFDLMSVRFSALPARRAYMAAGSLIRFLIATRGMETLLEAYHRGTVDELGCARSRLARLPREGPGDADGAGRGRGGAGAAEHLLVGLSA